MRATDEIGLMSVPGGKSVGGTPGWSSGFKRFAKLALLRYSFSLRAISDVLSIARP